MQSPDIEGHVLQEALRQYVVGVIMSVDEAGHYELAARFDDIRDARFHLGIRVRRRHRDDPGVFEQDIADRRVVDVAVLGENAGAAGEARPPPGLPPPTPPRSL